MKRIPVTYPKVREFKPLLFWKSCKFCKKEFRRELGYEIKHIGYGGEPYYEYCCNECCDSIDEVKVKLFELENERKNRFKNIPPPPKQPKNKGVN